METIWVAGETPARRHLRLFGDIAHRIGKSINGPGLGPAKHMGRVEFESSAEFCGWIFLVSGGPAG